MPADAPNPDNPAAAKPTKKPKSRAALTVRIPFALQEILSDVAYANRMSVNQFCNCALRNAIQSAGTIRPNHPGQGAKP